MNNRAISAHRSDGIGATPAVYRPWASAQRGLGIIEVLVALVVVSFGVLGMASLQLTGMKHSSSGFQRSKALLFAENMATRMRINAAGIDAFDYSAFDSNTTACNVQPVPYCQATVGGGVVPSCTASELAAFDLFSVSCGDWGSSGADKGVIGDLPTGRLQVGCDDTPCTATSTYTITVSWIENRTTSRTADSTDTKRVQVRLRP